MWSFQTDPDFQVELDWIAQFVREEVEPLDHILGNQYDITDPRFVALVRPLQARVKERGLWACHLGPELGGKGYGQVKLALMNEQFGRSRFGPIVFGSQAPDTGNSEILAHYGTSEQKKNWLEPLLDNQIVSCFAITEPQGGADPLGFEMTAVQDGDEWVLNGEKWFASNARYASFYIVMAVTDPEAANPYKRASMFIVSANTPGIEIIRHHGFYGEASASHGHVRWTNVRVPADGMLGERGDAFVVAQVRLGGGRMHHAMRTIAEATKYLEMMCQRVLSRTTKGELLARKQMVEEKIADSWIQLRQFRLMVLEAAWLADQGNSWKDIRKHVSAVKATMPKVLHDITERALHLHGSLGISTEAPFSDGLINSYHIALADGPTEVHKMVVAREVLKQFSPIEEMFPDYLLYRQEEHAITLYGDRLAEIGAKPVLAKRI
ncbi:acyl-CoA dehydrogenase family protein [Sphingobium sp. HBC34]|uniref:Acyl-CoA dehydrogenase family protein n=1 Tax=Sphingobium cyanobacteriorum TaxID=3063954 RepID=A0ABT8ZPQ5_9SPHN|nr:acyl-CoA dehydrogenase family protein [Sphingobium sp. HBC34]MDO7836491.1 acyl-CoA dehydrogenase family protein [Sphingobium sp. HBC34]